MSRGRRKIRVGRIVGDRMQKSVVVAVEWRRRHPLYHKSMRRFTRFVAQDEQNEASLGDLVRIMETRPLSKTKRWRVTEILERRDIPEVRPIEIDAGLGEAPAEEPAATVEAEAPKVEAPAEEPAATVEAEAPQEEEAQEEPERKKPKRSAKKDPDSPGKEGQ